jgi:hypothetical protein
MNRFNGVATKYINNYMYWFKWLQLFENDKEVVKIKNFMVQYNIANAYTKITDFKKENLSLFNFIEINVIISK